MELQEEDFGSDFIRMSEFRDKYTKKTDKNKSKLYRCKPGSCTRFLKRCLPCYGVMKAYKWRSDLVADLISGVTVGILQIPQGMAYSMLAEMPPIVGIYLAFFPVIVYFIFGTSRHISLGTVVAVSVLVGSVVTKFYGDAEFQTDTLDHGNASSSSNITSSTVEYIGGYNDSPIPNHVKIGIATTVGLLAGALQILMGVLRLGFVTTYLSDPLIDGFVTSVAFQGITSQVKYMLGLKVARTFGIFRILKTYRNVFANIGDTNPAAVVISCVSILLIYLVKYQVNQRFKHVLRMPIPIDLIVAIIGTTASYLGNFEKNFNIDIVGDLPTGLPTPTVPSFKGVERYISDIPLVAIIAFTQSVSLAVLMANKHNYKIDANQELIAYGASNMFGSFFACYPVAASVARTTLVNATGGKTQVSSLFSASLVLVVILWIGPLFEKLPKCCLSAVIVVALWSLCLKVMELPKLWRISKYDVGIWLITCLGTIFLQFDYGLLAGILFSILSVTLRSQLSKPFELGKVKDRDVFKNCHVYDKVAVVPNVKIIGFSHPIFFANAELLAERIRNIVHKSVDLSNTTIGKNDVDPSEPAVDILMENSVRYMYKYHVILDFTSVSFTDSVGCKILRQIISEFDLINVAVYITHVSDDVWRAFEATGLIPAHDKYIYLTTADALKAIND